MTNPQGQRRANRQSGSSYPVWWILVVCALVCAATSIIVRKYQRSMGDKSVSPNTIIPKSGCVIFDVDPEISPCDDFYKFACNKWQQQNPIPDWAIQWSFDALSEERITNDVKRIFEQTVAKDDLIVIRQAKDFYRKCVRNDDQYSHPVWNSLIGYHAQGLRRGKINPPRNKLCGLLVYQHFRFAFLHKLLEQNYKDRNEVEKIRTEVQTMFYNVKQTFYQEKSPCNKEIAKHKLCAGYPDFIFNPQRVQAGYNWVSLNADQSFETQMSYIETSKGFDLFDDKFQDYECNMWTVKPDNPRSKNYDELYLQMTELEPPVLDLNRPRAINYGSVGFTLANIAAPLYIDWKSITSKKCFIEQYKAFTLDYINEAVVLNSDNTFKQNLYQNFGLQKAYAAFSKVKSKGNERFEYTSSHTCQSNFTNAQLFFLGYAQSFCETLPEDDNIKSNIRRGFKVPQIFRVLGALQNFPQFSKAWQCPVGSNMNPSAQNKCKMV